MRNHFALLALVHVTLLSGLVACRTSNQADSSAALPNIILIMADDLGYETIGANGGSSYQTPRLDQLASEGMRFEHCYAQPLCTPTRVQLMTGIYNVRNYVRFGLLHKSQTTLGHLFQEAGYATCVVGKWQLGKEPDNPQQAGFDTHCLWQVGQGRVDSLGRDTRFSKPVLEIDGKVHTFEDTDYGPDVVCRFGLDFIEKSHNAGKPFLLYYPMILTHCPFSPTPNSEEWNSGDTSTMRYKGNAKFFGDMVHHMDYLVGKIVDKTKDLGIQENTIIIFTGDNGTDVPVVSIMNGREVAGAKSKSTDAGTRVPLIVYWPGKIQPNSVNRDLIDFTDFLPTLSETAGIGTDSMDLDGRSFLPQLLGEAGEPREWIYCWFSRNGESEKARVFARNHRYKLYQSGEFYDIPNDYEELVPLDTSALDTETMKTYEKLSEVLEHFGSKRLDKIPKPMS
jgi:arylsulfatase A